MKRPYKFLTAFLILTAVFSLLSAVTSLICLKSIQRETNSAITQIIAQVKLNYPETDETELIQILNGNASTASAKLTLEHYGIDPETQWIYSNSKSSAATTAVSSAVVCAAACLALCAVFIMYFKHCNKEVEKITDYVKQINDRKYDLFISDNSENEMSLLKNEIYKTSIALREETDNTQRDKENLKNSLSDISHQLKTPLTSILVLLDNIIEDEDMPAEIRAEFLNDIRKSANGISFLVQSLLTLSKLDANSIELKHKPESLEKIISTCIFNTSVPAELREVSVTCDIDPVLMLSCDFKWLCEAFTNIIKNCIEHTNAGGSVKISAEQNPLYTKVTVTDNGVGIDPDDLPHIFKRFYKGKNSNPDSIGIGLALSKAIIEKTDGTIYANSEINKGTKFTIKFHKLPVG